jgi:membrane-bound lytic murein transglycosylase B
MSLRLMAVLAGLLAVVTGAAFALQAHDRGSRDDHVGRAGGPAYDLGRLHAARPTAGSHAMERTARATGIPGPALRAYTRAQRTAPEGCGVGWTTLAGIGYVESHHGTLGGRTLLADGHSSSTILGPALDGSGAFAAIRSTSVSRSWHGDAVWEHAVGPMQFLPETWARYATDGDGVGGADPRDLDDAAAGAAAYLCAGGGDLRTAVAWEKAVLSYNHSDRYVAEVYAAAERYAGASDASHRAR